VKDEPLPTIEEEEMEVLEDDDDDDDDDDDEVLKKRRSPRERGRMGTSHDDDDDEVDAKEAHVSEYLAEELEAEEDNFAVGGLTGPAHLESKAVGLRSEADGLENTATALREGYARRQRMKVTLRDGVQGLYNFKRRGSRNSFHLQVRELEERALALREKAKELDAQALALREIANGGL
jgi:hypothetical protein